MCGIAGFWQRPGEDATVLGERVGRMAETLHHRGPDDGGTWVDAAAGVALGFRRLAILELSPLGHQPMTSNEQRYTIVFNGEIYNYRDLKADLISAGHSFRGGSDTEVILAGFSRWGIERTLGRIRGMFGIAVWDAEARTLTLVRDRIGKKPVYYGRADDAWLFGSELKALRAYPSFRAEIDREALAQFLRFGYVPAPRSIYRGIRKLQPGHFVTLGRDRDATPVCYWDAAAVAQEGQRDPLRLDDAQAINQLDVLLRDAVARRMIADVPLGAFLSGGLDSSTVVALMQTQSAAPVKTFTIGFDVPGYNEAEAAKAVAAHLHTEHTELYVTPDQARAVIPSLPTIYDEPFADSSQIPTYLVSRLARCHVTVSLSGDGGDELFAGYNRYFWGPRIWDRAKYLPAAVRRAVCSALERIPPEYLDRAYAAVERVLPSSWAVDRPGDKLHKLAGVLSAPDQMELYRRLVSAWHHPETVVIETTEPPVNGPARRYLPDGFCERMMYCDLVTYLPEDILVKVDRASMAVSLEVRAPLLDQRLVEWAWRLPQAQRVRNGSGKWLLRQLLYRHVPQELVDRPKTGFGVPIDHWLRGPLRDWAEDLLSEGALEAGGFLRAAPIRRVWLQHLGGHRNEQTRLWPILMFQAWRRHWLS
jgi:asparagine synthase (glutamine-hydrolysing)